MRKSKKDNTYHKSDSRRYELAVRGEYKEKVCPIRELVDR